MFPAFGGHLDEADLVEVVVEAVRLRVEAERTPAGERAGELGEGLGRADPGCHGREYTEEAGASRLAGTAGACNTWGASRVQEAEGTAGSSGARPKSTEEGL